MTESNDLLRQARQRLPSRAAPGESLSRQEVADLTSSWIYERHKTVVELDANYIGKLERGLIRWPHRHYREALRAVLRVETDAQLGFVATRRPSSAARGAAAKDQQLIGVAGSSAVLPWSELFAPTEATPIPDRVTQLDIDQVRMACATFKHWDNTFGGGLAREAVYAQLRWSAQLLHAQCPEHLRNGLFAAVAEFGGVTGFMAFDAFAHDDARRTLRFSLRCAEESGDWHLRSSILSMLARQAIWCGEADAGLTYVELALVRNDRLTATERASLHTLRARAFAKLARVQDCLSAVGAADAAFADATPGADPAWMAYYDRAQHSGDTAHALFDLSIQGRRTPAARRLAYAVAHHRAEYARSRTISQTKLASLLLRTGDPRRAAAVGQQALDGAQNLRSRRAIEDVRELHRYAGEHVAIPDVVYLRDRIAEVLRARA